ncbi:hypothetical protein BDY24DRAFT_229524 [Mrakia frigida]|uniref:uncharacterized protein n=1 Tax=Mrakia frigida TaxID=29902 RepID=UPI003FCC2248
MGILSHLPRSRPVRLGILVVLCIGVLHLLDLLPSTASSSSLSSSYRRPATPYPQTPRREDPLDLQQYLGKVLEQARKDSSSDHGNRKSSPSRPQQPFDKDEFVSVNGNTLVLATHSSKDLLGLLSVQKGLDAYGKLVLPGINSGGVKSWVPKENVDESSLAVQGLIKWIDQVRKELETGKKVSAEKRLGDTEGGIGGVVLGSCEVELVRRRSSFISFPPSLRLIGPELTSCLLSTMLASPSSPPLSSNFTPSSLRPSVSPSFASSPTPKPSSPPPPPPLLPNPTGPHPTFSVHGLNLGSSRSSSLNLLHPSPSSPTTLPVSPSLNPPSRSTDTSTSPSRPSSLPSLCPRRSNAPLGEDPRSLEGSRP